MQPGATLLVIDMQRAIDAPYWAKDGPRNNPGAEEAGVRLLTTWRARGWPVVHVRHDSVEPQSSYRPGQEGNNFKPGFEPLEGERVFPKHTGSAFTATGLDSYLRTHGFVSLCVFGVITNNSVETTVRHASTLGYEVYLIEDACFTFARRDYRGVQLDAESVHAMSLANLAGEYCTVTNTAQVLQALGGT